MKPKEQTVGYLPQIMSYSKDTTVLEAAMSVFADHFTMNERVEEISRELGERTDYESEGPVRVPGRAGGEDAGRTGIQEG